MMTFETNYDFFKRYLEQKEQCPCTVVTIDNVEEILRPTSEKELRGRYSFKPIEFKNGQKTPGTGIVYSYSTPILIEKDEYDEYDIKGLEKKLEECFISDFNQFCPKGKDMEQRKKKISHIIIPYWKP